MWDGNNAGKSVSLQPAAESILGLGLRITDKDCGFFKLSYSLLKVSYTINNQ